MEIVIKVVLAYLLGSLMGGLLIGKLRGVDIRTTGSGNAGTTNAWRSGGAAFGLMVFVIDIGKGLMAVLLLPGIGIPGMERSAANAEWLPYLCGVAVVIGHVYPVLFGFRGGKGAATLAGVVAVLLPQTLPVVIAAWLLCLILTGMVGLSTMVAAAAATVTIAVLGSDGVTDPALLFAISATLLVLFTHRANIRRMLAGNENRFQRVMLLHRLFGRQQP